MVIKNTWIVDDGMQHLVRTFLFYQKLKIVQSKIAKLFWLYNKYANNGAADSENECSDTSQESSFLSCSLYNEIAQENIVFAKRIAVTPGPACHHHLVLV